MPETLMPDDVVAAAAAVEAALRPFAGRDWSVQAGPLEWNVEQTITHMIGATAKYTLYLASRCEHFIRGYHRRDRPRSRPTTGATGRGCDA